MSFKLKLSFLVIAGACFCCGAQAENLNSEKAGSPKAEPAARTGTQLQTAEPAATGTATADEQQKSKTDATGTATAELGRTEPQSPAICVSPVPVMWNCALSRI